MECFARSAARAIRRAGWVTTCCSINWRSGILRRWRKPKSPGSSPFVLTACAPFQPIGRKPPDSRRLNITRSSWRGTATDLPQTGSGEKIVYHDPCYLGRYRGVYDEPRALIAMSGEAVDPPRSRERGFCCGAGGGLAFLGEETGQRVSHARAEELCATGAQVVAAACPFCNSMLRDALPSVSATPPKLLDISQIIAANLPQP